MSNSYFQFKQFTVHQGQCAMKVCTDACLFGAFIANEIESENITIDTCLDIGAGTGLLSLMLAQKIAGNIDAVEIDGPAYLQANKNFEHSPWRNRLAIFNTDILQFDANKKYDYIISNPPFFEGDLKSTHANKNAARHDTALTIEQLLVQVDRFLNEDGLFAVLLPYQRVSYCIAEALKLNLHLCIKTLVRQTPGHAYFRGMLIFSRKKIMATSSVITINNENGNYTEAFTTLLKAYYLNL